VRFPALSLNGVTLVSSIVIRAGSFWIAKNFSSQKIIICPWEHTVNDGRQPAGRLVAELG